MQHQPRLRLNRRTLISGVAGFALSSQIGRAAAAESVILNPCDYLQQGGTGDDQYANCGPTATCMAIRYSGIAHPEVEDLRNHLGFNGATGPEHWTALFNLYGVPYREIYGRDAMIQAVTAGEVIVCSTEMFALSQAEDYGQPLSPHGNYVGRFNSFSGGHALLLVGIGNDGSEYIVHDSWVFAEDPVGYYEDGTPKGAFRRYDLNELSEAIDIYGSGLGLAVSRAESGDHRAPQLPPPIPGNIR